MFAYGCAVYGSVPGHAILRVSTSKRVGTRSGAEMASANANTQHSANSTHPRNCWNGRKLKDHILPEPPPIVKTLTRPSNQDETLPSVGNGVFTFLWSEQV